MRQSSRTWEDVHTRLSYFLDDDDGSIYPQERRIVAWNWAQRMLVWHTPRSRNTKLTVDTDERSAILPPDFLGVWRIHDAEVGRWFRPMRQPQPGSIRHDDGELSQYWVWEGKLIFERTVELGDVDIELYYWSYWPEVEYEVVDSTLTVMDDVVLVPPWSVLPLSHLTAATLLIPGAIQAARTRQWNIRIDAGTPLDNVRAQQAREHAWWYTHLLSLAIPADWRTSPW